jgi:ribosome-binding protein aMBF1 (putative translation factor)
VTQLSEKWSAKRTCWLCGREVQGAELHFFMCKARVTPYTQQLLEAAGHDTSMIDLTHSKVAVCTSCLSIISFKAVEEAEKVRQDLSKQLQEARDEVQTLKARLSRLEQTLNQPYKG